jgi:hypothetical protein
MKILLGLGFIMAVISSILVIAYILGIIYRLLNRDKINNFRDCVESGFYIIYVLVSIALMLGFVAIIAYGFGNAIFK